MAEPGFWDNSERAQETVGQLKSANVVLKPLAELIRSGDELAALVEMAQEDEGLTAEVPSELVVQCQNERSQHKNRATAYKMLRSRLARIEEEKREAEQLAKYNLQPKSGFGAQIRSYFQHPDQRVKDERSGHKVGNFQTVLDGNIQDFLDSILRWRVGEKV